MTTTAPDSTAEKIAPTGKTDVTIILDRSFSMDRVKRAAIDGYNEYGSTIRANADKGGETRLSTVLFNHNVEPLFWQKSLDDFVPMDEKTYQPAGNTAFLDAFGSSVARLEKLEDADEPDHAFLVVCVTDVSVSNGQENASTNYTWRQIGETVKRLEATGRWTFVFVGSDMDMTAAATSDLHVPVMNTKTFEHSDAGMREAFAATSTGGASYFAARSRGDTSSSSYFAPDTSSASEPSDAWHPTIPPTPATPPSTSRPPRRPKSGSRGTSRTGARSPLLGGDSDPTTWV